jgi:hypothetical protein
MSHEIETSKTPKQDDNTARTGFTEQRGTKGLNSVELLRGATWSIAGSLAGQTNPVAQDGSIHFDKAAPIFPVAGGPKVSLAMSKEPPKVYGNVTDWKQNGGDGRILQPFDQPPPRNPEKPNPPERKSS